MCRQRSFERPRIACKHACHFAKTEAERAQLHNVAGTSHLGGTIRTPSRPSADGANQAAILVNSQSLGGDAELFCSLGRVQESVGRVHESPRFRVAAPYAGGPKG